MTVNAVHDTNTGITPDTIYDSVVFRGDCGIVVLSLEQLRFHHTTANKISIVPWNKVVRRQVTSSSCSRKPMFKLALQSGNEAIFQMPDRVSLEVLRDDLGERLRAHRKLHPLQPDHPAVNKTRHSFSDCRTSTPYSMCTSSSSSSCSIHHDIITPPTSTMCADDQSERTHTTSNLTGRSDGNNGICRFSSSGTESELTTNNSCNHDQQAAASPPGLCRVLSKEQIQIRRAGTNGVRPRSAR